MLQYLFHICDIYYVYVHTSVKFHFAISLWVSFRGVKVAGLTSFRVNTHSDAAGTVSALMSLVFVFHTTPVFTQQLGPRLSFRFVTSVNFAETCKTSVFDVVRPARLRRPLCVTL